MHSVCPWGLLHPYDPIRCNLAYTNIYAHHREDAQATVVRAALFSLA